MSNCLKYGNKIYKPEVLFDKIRNNAAYFVKKHGITTEAIMKAKGLGNTQQNVPQYSKQDLRQAAKDMISRVVSLAFNRKKGTESITVGYFNDYAKSLIEEVSGLKLKKQVSFEINESDVRHSVKEHLGTNEIDNRNYPIKREDYDKILDIASNPDRIIYIGVEKNTGLKLFSFQKEYENGDYAIVKFVGKSGGRLSFKTFYQNKKGVQQRQNEHIQKERRKPKQREYAHQNDALPLNAQTRSVVFPSYNANIQNLLNFDTDTNKKYVDHQKNIQYSLLKPSDLNPDGTVKDSVLKEIEAEKQSIIADAKKNGTYLKAPNGEDTKLNEEQWVQVRTKRFKDWFGDWENDLNNASKVVDENGEPLVVYHGTENRVDKDGNISREPNSDKFYTFDSSKEGYVRGRSSLGHFFTSNRALAYNYAEWSPYGYIHEVFLNLRNITEIDAKGRYYYDIGEGYNTDTFADKIVDSNLDGGFIRNVVDLNFMGKEEQGKPSDLYIATNPNQIKSATDNVGTYSTENNDIRFQIVGDNPSENQSSQNSNDLTSITPKEELYDKLMPAKTLQSLALAVQGGDLAKAKEVLEQSGWYKNLPQIDKKKIDQLSLKKVVLQQAQKRQEYKKLQTPEGIKEVFEKKIDDYKNAKLDTRSKVALKREAQRQAAYAIKQYVEKNRMKGKLTPEQANRLIKLATDISTPRQNLKSVYGKIEKFIETYETIKEKNKYTTTTQEQLKTIFENANTQIHNGVNVNDIKNKEEKKTAERILERERAKSAPKWEGFKIQEEAFEASDKKIREKKPRKEIVRKLAQSITDRQFVPKKLLEETGMDNALNRFINIQGANGRAKEWMSQLDEQVYKGVFGKDYVLLNRIIDARSTISIDQYREKEGLPPIDHHNGFNQYYAQDALDGIKELLGEKKFKELNDRASAYFAFHHQIVDKLVENGIVSEDTAKVLKSREYSPRFFLEHMEDFEGNIDEQHSEVFGNRSSKLSKGAVQSLSEGSKGLKVNDTQYLMHNYVSKMSQLIAQNEANKTFATREFPKAKQRYEVLKNKKKLSKEERRFVKYFEELESKVIFNPITGVTPSGNLKYQYDTAPKGFSKNYYYEDGVKHEFFLADELHNQWNDLNRGFLSSDVNKEKVTIYSGSGLVKNFATGNNPFFFLSNTPRDFLQTALVSDQYSTFALLGWSQVAKDAIIGIREARKHTKGKNGLMDKYIEYGGMMDFLNKQGMVKKDSIVDQSLNKLVGGHKNAAFLKKVIKWITLKNLNNYSEIMFRVGLMHRTLNNQLKAYNKENGTNYASVEELDQQTQDDMYYRAVREARSVLDFNQGGTITKDLETIAPYINAATQGTRVVAKAFQKNPVKTTLKMMQAGAFLTTTMAGISMACISAFRDDDEKDKTHIDIYLDTLNGVNEFVRRSNLIIPLGVKDEAGNWRYITIAKPQEMQPLFILMDRVQENILRGIAGKELLGWNLIVEDVRRSFDSALPVNIFANPLSEDSQVIQIASMNPVVKGVLAVGYGINPFTKQKVSKDVGKVELSEEGMDDNRIEGFYKTLAPLANMSPARTKTFVEGLITQPTTNPYISLIYAGLDLVTGNSDGDKLLDDLKTTATRRVLRETSPFNYKMNLEREFESDIKATREVAGKNQKILKDAVQYIYEKNITGADAQAYVQSKIDAMDVSEKEKVELIKSAKKMYRDMKTKNNSSEHDAILESIRREKSSTVRAKMLQQYFGNTIPKDVYIRGKEIGGIFTDRVNSEYARLINENKKP